MNEPTKESLLNQVNAIADQRGLNFVLRKDFKQETGIGDHYIFKYWNSLSEFFSEAGLTPQNREPLSNEELFKAAFNVLITEESIPAFIRFGKLIQYSQAVYKRRFGTWLTFLTSLKEWIRENKPTSPLANKLETYIEQMNSSQTTPSPSTAESSVVWHSSGGRRFGPFLNFRGLQHAPINEQGVVFLFGIVAFELGYVVESVATGFPDCKQNVG